ncbi:MAG TPA: alanine racemase, partial [Firmicutes bacterium]|nr:alanine racemase [Bacillota bacterium]
LGYANKTQLESLVRYDLSPVLTNPGLIPLLEKEAAKQKKRVKITLKCETGTHRQGLLLEEIPEYTTLLKKTSFLTLEGLSTHFANIEDTSDHSYARKQITLFKEFLHRFEKAGLPPQRNHIACSAATILFPDTHYQMVRTGISSYGYWSSKETYLSFRAHTSKELNLEPVLTWKTRIGQIKDVGPDAYIGYGCTYRTNQPTRLAILPVGYYDGFDRKLSNSGHVLIHGKRAPVRGRVCMNMIIVDITHIPGCRLNDEVILLGRSGDERLTADDMASLAGTINYEVLSRINPLIPRRIVP